MTDAIGDSHVHTLEEISVEISLNDKANKIAYFPQLVNQSKPINSQSRFLGNNYLEDEEGLEELVINETEEFLENLMHEERPESAFYAISRPDVTPGLFGAGIFQPPENIYKLFKYNSQVNETLEEKNSSVIKVTKTRTRKNPSIPSSKPKGKKPMKQELSSNEDKMDADNGHVKKQSKRQLIEVKPKKRTNKPKPSECHLPSKKEIGIIEKVQRMIEKRKRRKELKEKRNVIKESINNVIGSPSPKNTSIKNIKIKRGDFDDASISPALSKNTLTKTIKAKRDFDDSSSTSSLSSSSSESSSKRKRRLDRFSRSSSTSSTVKSAKTSSLKKKQKKTHGNHESESSTEKASMAVLSSDSTV
ncbi:3579_t:CDS:1 [Acaulospora colombiana]|uniref:3579_t:CDS:1 n=1 Tax=Acaulospora colombiana TaxID=27376 RepID=A0ACA9M1A4_9GLOM|nr:3579_t:CDS:1 [Acaulospora colombiana]